MSVRAPIIFSFCLCVLAVAYAAIADQGDPRIYSTAPLLMLGLAGVACIVAGFHSDLSRLDRIATWSAVLSPTYVAFQLVPLPLVFIRILDSTRAEVASALGNVMAAPALAPISIVPSQTWLHLGRIAGYTLIFLLVREAARRAPNHLWVLVVPLLALAGLEAWLGLAQRSAGAEVISGSYVDKDLFAGLLEMVLPFALMYGLTVLYRGREQYMLQASSVIKASGLLALTVGMFAAIAFSLAKMGFVATLGSLFVMGILTLSCRISGRKKWAAFTGLAVVVLLVFIFLSPNELVTQFGSVANDPTAEGRWPVLKDSLHLAAAYPLFGSGLGTFSPGLLRYQNFATNAAAFDFAHNDYAQLLAELGILGFLIPAALICAVFARALRAAVSAPNVDTRFLGLACVGALTAILIHSFTEFNMYVPANAMVLSWICGISASLPIPVHENQPVRWTIPPSWLRGFTLSLGCLTSLYAGAWLIFGHSFQNDLRVERLSCRFGICNSDGVLAALQSQHGGDVASVPPAELGEMVRRDSASPNRWEDLGESLKRAGRTDEAHYCFARALVLGPRVEYMLFRAANFHFDLGENREATALMVRTLEADPTYGEAVFTEYDRRHVTIENVLRQGLPARPDIWRSYLRWQIQQDRTSDAVNAWKAIVTRGYADDRLANEQVEFLMRKKQLEDAQRAWVLYAGGRSKGYPESDRVFNGDFELDPTGSPFDWSLGRIAGATLDFDRNAHYSGARSLRIQFNGKQNLTKAGLYQTVFLKPGRYRFKAYVRAQGLSTDEGVALKLADAESGNRMSITTESVLGSTDWRPIERIFEVPAGTGLVNIDVVRKASLKFDNLIRGTMWIDQVSIRPETVQAK